MYSVLDDQGALPNHLDKTFRATYEAVDGLKDSIEGLIPDEPDYPEPEEPDWDTE